MKFACMTCGAKYSVPDGRLEDAGPQGLRIRCSRCRAIMVVSESQRLLTPTPPRADIPPDEEEETRKELRHRSRRGGPPTISTDSLQRETSPQVHDDGMPAALSASGVYRPLPGVQRQVTGLFFPELDELQAEGKLVSSRVWYAAVDSRPRGPFSASEMVSLAEQGKIRESTLVWRPGFSTWKQVRHADDGGREDLGWLRKIVKARKLRERDAQRRAEALHGIKPVSLTRTSSGGRRTDGSSVAPGMPPPLPEDAVDDIQPLAQSSGFHWRAQEHPAAGVRRQTRLLWALGVGAFAVVAVAVAVVVLRANAIERLIGLLLQ